MPVSIRIQFDSPYATYYAGQTVSGRVYLSVDKPKKIRAITINVKGGAEVCWQESERQKDAQGKDYEATINYTSDETYFENNFYLLGSASGEVDLAQGEYNYPFQCQLPPTLPSSFEGEHGHIRYVVKVVLDRPWKFDSEAKAAFTVVAPLDLNTIPQAKEPVEFEKSKSFCCLWCKSGPLTLTVRLPAGGYVPGQVIPFQIEVENASNIRVRPINCVLRKEVTWHAKTPHNKTQVSKTKLVDLAVDDEVNAHDSKSFSKDITVPAVPPSNLANCGIIDLEYILKIEAVVGGCHSNLNARIPILMGTIPLLTGPTAFKPGTAPIQPIVPPTNPAVPPGPADGPPAPSVGGGWNIPSPATGDSGPLPSDGGVMPSAPPLYPQLPPPSYEESIFKGNTIKDASDNEHTMGIQDFTPRYPVWTFDTVKK